MPNIIFSPPAGLFTDDTPFADEGVWRSGSNIRFWNGKPQVIGGWISTGIFTPSSGVPSKLHEWTALDGTTRYLAMGTTTALYVTASGTFSDITPVSLGTATRWSLHPYGQTLMASPKGGKLYQWSNVLATPAAEIVNAPDNITCMLTTNQRQVVALGCNEEGSGTFNGLCIRWCDIEDPTDWTTSPSNNAGEFILEGSGLIVAGQLLGEGIAVWTTDSLFYGTFIGDPAQTYRFDKVGAGCGLLSMDGATCINGTAYWITPDLQFFVWAPGLIPKPIPCPLINFFQGDINTTKSNVIQKVFAFYNTKFSEVWFFYPSGSSSTAQPTKYLAVSTIDGKWFTGAFARTAMHQGLTALYGATSARVTYFHENGQKGDAASVLSWTLASGDSTAPDAEGDVMIREVWGDFGTSNVAQTGTLTLTVGMSRYPQSYIATGNILASQAVTFNSGIVRKSLRISGRFVTVGLAGDDASGVSDTFMRLGKLVFDIVPSSAR